MAIRRIGQILIDLGFLNEDQLTMLLEEQQHQPGELLGKIAEEMALITDEQLCQALAEQFNLQVVSLEETLARSQLSRDEGFEVIGVPLVFKLDRDFVVRRSWQEATGSVQAADVPSANEEAR